MDKLWVSHMQSRHARGDLLPPSAGLASPQWKVPPADPAPAAIPCQRPVPLLDRALVSCIVACLLAEIVLAGVMAWGLR